MNPAYLHPIDGAIAAASGPPDYYYLGTASSSAPCPAVPRTPMAKAVAQGLMAEIRQDPDFNQEGKMYGVLLVSNTAGQTAYLKAFSGLWRGQGEQPGWVPPISRRGCLALQEAHTLQALEAIKLRLSHLQHLPERSSYEAFQMEFDRQRQALNQRHRQRKAARNRQRQAYLATLQEEALTSALELLAQESRRDKAELRAWKQARAAKLDPLAAQIEAADGEIKALKQRRKILSSQLQAEMHRVYSLTNFAGQSLTIRALAGEHSLPTGTGDCCAPKLLHFAATHNLRPLAMAEFWWGPATADKQPGKFYGACAERCQPIMGFLLAGLSASSDEMHLGKVDFSLPLLYEDDWLVAVSKPPGLLSTPGRYSDSQDSVLSRLQNLLPDGEHLVAVHRLDQATSGVLILARHKDAERLLRQKFQTHRVSKTYEAMLNDMPAAAEGSITLPLWGDPEDRPRQIVDWQRGKPCETQYRVVEIEESTPRVEFYPRTGRTHQLRVHAAHPMGLNAPICGDRLYGAVSQFPRLYLHARELKMRHPESGRELVLRATTPF